jgi:hypothetical protein
MTSHDNKDEYYVPLEDQRVFGAGIKRKRIAFVPASTTTTTQPPTIPNTTSIADQYLSIVLAGSSATAKDKSVQPTAADTTDRPNDSTPPLDTRSPPHHPKQSSIAHQLTLEHSHPPSHLDRSRAGLRYLTSYGFDPDSRTGLGARGEGIRYPLKPQPKHDTVGLRERIDDEASAAMIAKSKRDEAREKEKRVVMVDAKEVRRRDGEAKRKAERLRRVFYASDDVEKYLGEGG